MGGIPITVTVLYLVAAAVALTVAWLRGHPSRRPPNDPRQRAIRRTTRWRWVGVAVGATLGVAVAAADPLDLGALLAAPVFGICVLVGVLIGEASVAPPGGPTRTAALEVRTVRDYLPRRMSRAVAVAAVGLLALLVVTSANSGPDDAGNPGRALELRCPPTTAEEHGPWPGAFYSVPLAVVVLLGLVVAYVVLRNIVRRPRPGGTPDLIAVDNASRRRTARAVTGAVGILVGLPLAGVAATASWALLSTACGPAWGRPVGWFLLVAWPVVIALTVWWTTAVLVPKRATAAGVAS
ncbi:hypothetical protein ABZ541_19395 [Micromonospora sediminicola]|uniref:hypothetical protein n=1 Tax=Micromonospora sediminicola TaxID=946078 RepID=UPI0033DC3484